jgi:hypothetical protein
MLRTIDIIANSKNALPPSDCGYVTFHKIIVTDIAISSCKLIIGKDVIRFSTGDYPMKSVLTVDGRPEKSVTCYVIPNSENEIEIILPTELSQQTGGAKMQLYFQFSYSLP